MYDIASRWKNFGAAVGVSRAEINKIDGEEKGADNCLTKVLEALLKMNHDVKKFGVPSWQMIARAVGQRNGGADLQLALIIAKDHSTSPGALQHRNLFVIFRPFHPLYMQKLVVVVAVVVEQTLENYLLLWVQEPPPLLLKPTMQFLVSRYKDF